MKKNESGIQQKKTLGQVFLHNDWPCKQTAETLKKFAVTHVLEIGPGEGVLTQHLLKGGFQVTAVEHDERFAQFLGEKFAAMGNLQIVRDDILKFDVSSWLATPNARYAIVGNIPYYISSDILKKALRVMAQLTIAQFLVQLEFAERLAAKHDTKEYGSLSVFAQLRARVSLDAKVSRGCFTPQPNVDSALLTLLPREKPLPQDDLDVAEKLSRHVFQQRRKMLKSSLKPFLRDVTGEPPFDLTLRPEDLTPEDLLKLAHYVFPKKV